MTQQQYAVGSREPYRGPTEPRAHDYGVGTAGAEGAVVVRRISWGAILAGLIIYLVVQALLSLLGVGIGVSTIDPLGSSPEAGSFATGAGIWWVLSALIAVFAGSWVAGRVAGIPVKREGMLHGVLTWGLATLVMIYLVTTTLGSLLGGAFSTIGTAMQSVAGGAQAAGQAAGQDQGGSGLLADVRRQIEGVISRQVDQAMPQVQQGVQQVQQASQNPEVRQLLEKVVTSGPDTLTPAERQQAVSALSEHAGIPPAEAERRLNEWQAQYQQAEQKVTETAEATADTVSQASIWLFVALLLGAVVGGFGGATGAPRQPLRV
jgi:hypothetical protein